MAIIRQLFRQDRNPTRPLNEIVNTEQALDVRSEIDEYVFTDHTREYLRTLVDALLDTAQGQKPDVLCGWIAGFFGSGKSHFLKLAAAALENRPLDRVADGVGAFEYLVQRHELKIPHERICREFRVRSIMVNLALALGGGKRERERPLLHRLESEIYRGWGLSRVPHVAAIEREIKATGKWETLLDLVRKRNEGADERDEQGVPLEWTDARVRDLASEAHRILEDVLPKVLHKYTNVRDYLRDREAVQASPEEVVKLAVELARSLDPELGRVLLCVDEIALYLKGSASSTFDGDRVREVQGLAELVKDKGQGRVFLLATAQLRVDDIDAKLTDLKDHVLFLHDRFPKAGRLELDPRDIDEVVRERWLQKDERSPHLQGLRQLFAEHGGLLASVAKLREIALLRDDDQLTDEKALVAYYPLLPYHVRLLQEILSALRHDDQVGHVAAQNRAILADVRQLFAAPGGLADAPLGELATFDRVFEVMRGVVQRADPDTVRWIHEYIDPLPKRGNVSAGQVARVVLLLQRLNQPGRSPRVRVSAENVAALLYPRLGAPWEPHIADVRAALGDLVHGTFVADEPDAGYRFYRADEQSFRKKVAKVHVDERAVYELLCKATHDALVAVGLGKHALASKNQLAVEIVSVVDSPSSAPATGLSVEVVWATSRDVEGLTTQWAARFARQPARVLCAVTLATELYELVREGRQLEIALADHERDHEGSGDILRKERAKLNRLRSDELPEAIRRLLDRAVVVHDGRTIALAGSGKPFQELVRGRLAIAVQRTLTELDVGDVAVDDPKRALTWKLSQPLPDAFAKLALFDHSQNVLVDRAFLKMLLDDLRGPEDERTGAKILERFRRAPFGWPENAVKAGYAALLRARRIVVRPPGQPPITREDERAQDWIGTASKFNRAVIEAAIAPSREEIDRLASILGRVFERRGLDTLEKQEREIAPVLSDALEVLGQAEALLEGGGLPGATALAAATKSLEQAREAHLPQGQLKALLAASDAMGEAELQRCLELARQIALLRAAQKMDRLVRARARALRVYSQVQSLAGAEELGALALDEQRLFVAADDILLRDERCFSQYADRFRSRHAEVARVGTELCAALEQHPGWPLLSDARRRAHLEQLAACQEPGDLALATSPRGECPSCSHDFAGLDTHLVVLGGREAAARRELEALVQPARDRAPVRRPTPPGASRQLTLEIGGDDDIPAALETIEAALRNGQGERLVSVSIRTKGT